MLQTSLKPKPCAQCGSMFMPFSSTSRVCGRMCASRWVRAQNDAKKAEHKARRAALKTIPDLIKEAQVAFNKFIRARDAVQGCISCGAPPPDASGLHAGRDAGHYRSVGSAPHLRFDERNCNAQCVRCNQWRAGNAVDYRLGLVSRIGVSAVEALEAENAVHKWTREELIEIRKTYAAKARELKRTQGEG